MRKNGLLRSLLSRHALGMPLVLLAGFFLGEALAGPPGSDMADVQARYDARESVYHYSVINRGDADIVSFTVGYNHYRAAPELSGDYPLEVKAPQGWIGYVVALEENSLYEVTWHVQTSALAIKPGNSLAGFVIRTAVEDSQFATAHWSIMIDGPASHASFPLQAQPAE